MTSTTSRSVSPLIFGTDDALVPAPSSATMILRDVVADNVDHDNQNKSLTESSDSHVSHQLPGHPESTSLQPRRFVKDDGPPAAHHNNLTKRAMKFVSVNELDSSTVAHTTSTSTTSGKESSSGHMHSAHLEKTSLIPKESRRTSASEKVLGFFAGLLKGPALSSSGAIASKDTSNEALIEPKSPKPDAAGEENTRGPAEKEAVSR